MSYNQRTYRPRRYARRPAIPRRRYATTARRAPARRAPTRRTPYQSTKTVGSSFRNKLGSTFGAGLGSVAGGIAGSLLSPMLGPAASVIGSGVGGYLTEGAMNLINRISGSGDYKVNVNTLMSADPVPEFQNIGNRCTVIRHREFIQDVQAGALLGSYSAFDITSLEINPGNAAMFPWLSQIAQNYEQYRFHGLIFEFKTTSGSSSSTPMLGTVIMATQYNSLSTAFTNKQQMENYEFAGSTVPSTNLIHPIECDPKETQCNGIFNVKGTAANNGGDLRLYNLGTFNIATVGLPVAQEIPGELWVSYDICLMKPRLVPGGVNNADHWLSRTGAGFTSGSQYFGTDAEYSVESDEFTQITGTTITFDRGFYGNVCVNYYVNFTAAGTSYQAPSMVGSNGVNDLNIFDDYTISGSRSPTSTTATSAFCQKWFYVQPLSNSTTPTITLSGGTFGTVNAVDLVILQVPSNFY